MTAMRAMHSCFLYITHDLEKFRIMTEGGNIRGICHVNHGNITYAFR
ncbi:hypothetical protein SXCC_03864 [Gluconacetobacter sp. SXCC-1]|nr:hypothetical protein SXCC_03864 [Gluconacetobacter sp. SXCC-1]